MQNIYKNVKFFFRGGCFILLLFLLCSEECRMLIKEDVMTYNRKNPSVQYTMLDIVFDEAKRPFRNVLYYRFNQDNCNRRLLKVCKFFVRPLLTVEIGGKIDGGLKIVHNYCVINVKRAGKNLTVLQGVTIGANNGTPTIGDNVIVFPNSTVIGNIVIGDNATVGAGTFVNKDVPAYATVVGNPFKILHKS